MSMGNGQAVTEEQHIAGLLAQAIADDLELDRADDVDRDAPFTDLGLDSAGVIAVSAQMSEQLGREVSAESFFAHVTVAELAGHLAQTAAPLDGPHG